MREYVLLWPAREVEKSAGRKVFERRCRDRIAPLARQHGVELRAQRMKMQDVGRRVAQLLVGQLGRAPIGALLLLRQLDPEQILAQIFQTVAVGEGADQFRGDLGAIDRRGKNAELMAQHGDVEAPEMKQFENRRIGEQGAQPRRLILGGGELHEMADPIARRELHEAQPVPMRVQPHRLGVDRDDAGEVDFDRESAAVKMNAHG